MRFEIFFPHKSPRLGSRLVKLEPKASAAGQPGRCCDLLRAAKKHHKLKIRFLECVSRALRELVLNVNIFFSEGKKM